MKKTFINILSVVLLGSLVSCFGQHNKAVVESLNQDSERIYGVKNGDPKQLSLTYPDDETGEVADRIANIREKMFPQ